jgi:metallo-beta-lactamase family protein
MFQGERKVCSDNLRALPFDVRELGFVLLTHAHIDYSGMLPRLALLGYKGPIYTTPATIDLLQVLLLDSAHICRDSYLQTGRHPVIYVSLFISGDFYERQRNNFAHASS